MSIFIDYKGRSGNRLFQYVTARLYADQYRLDIINHLNSDLVQIINHNTACVTKHNSVPIIITGDNIYHTNGSNRNLIFSDFFQDSDYFNCNINNVFNMFKLQPITKDTDDIVLHIRLDDFWHDDWENSEVVHPSYYTQILDNEKYSKVYIVIDKIKYDWEHKYIANFDKYNPIIVSNTAKEDFNFIRQFDKIVTSNSTFAYWAAFLSEASTIYTFQHFGKFGRNMINRPHVKNLHNIKNISIPINTGFYHND